MTTLPRDGSSRRYWIFVVGRCVMSGLVPLPPVEPEPPPAAGLSRVKRPTLTGRRLAGGLLPFAAAVVMVACLTPGSPAPLAPVSLARVSDLAGTGAPAVRLAPGGAPTLNLLPPAGTIYPGDTITITVKAVDMANLGGFEFALTYNP